MPKKKHKTQSDVRTRRALMDLLKQIGPQDARDLSEQLGVSAMAVRQHLYALEEENLVTYEEQPRPKGRPAKLWRLTPAANRFFPDAHAELTVDLIGALGEIFGSGGLEKLLAVRVKQQIALYRKRIPLRLSLRRRLDALAKIRTKEGYMAEVLLQKDGSLLLVENHCPICDAANACVGLCGAELEVFQAVLGKQVEITRTEHIISGARRCAYQICSHRRQAAKG